MKVLIVDDEEPARLLLREYLSRHDGMVVVGEAGNGLEALRQAQALGPELILLDVQMPKLNGFEVLELLDGSPTVIFTTAYDEYALRAFEVHAVDYLLKPFSQERFDLALQRARERVSAPLPLSARQLAAAGRPAGAFPERIVVRDGTRVEIFPVDQLDFVRSRGDYIELVAGKRSALKQQTLQGIEAELDPRHFVRIHRSVLLNVERLARIEPLGKDSKIAVLRDGRQLPLSRTGETRLREVIG